MTLHSNSLKQFIKNVLINEQDAPEMEVDFVSSGPFAGMYLKGLPSHNVQTIVPNGHSFPIARSQRKIMLFGIDTLRPYLGDIMAVWNVAPKPANSSEEETDAGSAEQLYTAVRDGLDSSLKPFVPEVEDIDTTSITASTNVPGQSSNTTQPAPKESLSVTLNKLSKPPIVYGKIGQAVRKDNGKDVVVWFSALQNNSLVEQFKKRIVDVIQTYITNFSTKQDKSNRSFYVPVATSVQIKPDRLLSLIKNLGTPQDVSTIGTLGKAKN